MEELNDSGHATATEHLVKCVALRTGDCLRVRDGGGLLVHVAQGRAWITEEHVFEDAFVDTGSAFRLQRRGLAIVEALDDAVLLLVAPEASGWAERLSVRARPPYPRAAPVGLARPASRPCVSALATTGGNATT